MRTGKISWPVSLFIVGYHLFLLIALPLYFKNHSPSAGLLVFSAATVFICGIAITAGYHRLFSHLTYKTNPIIEAIYLFFCSIATQGSALRWAHDHRMHHAFSDTEKDPYSVTDGFFHAHVTWMLRKGNPIDPKVVADLLKNPLIRFQHRFYVLCMLVANASVFLFAGWLFNDYLGAFLFAWWVRLLVSHHTTWCINSLAHMWGAKNYSKEHTSVDNYIISLITYGEGYHNYHHTFPNDYRNGIRWYHFDPGKWLIWTLNKFGLARDVKKINDFRIAKEMIINHKEKILSALKNVDLEKKVTLVCDLLLEKLTTLQSLYEKARVIPKEEIRKQIKTAKKEWKQHWRDWKQVLKAVQNQRGRHLSHL